MATKSAAKKKPAKKTPARKKAAAKTKSAASKPAAAKKAAVNLREAESLIEAELERPEKSSSSAASRPRTVASVPVVASSSGGSVRNKDITAFLRQLVMMLDAGTPILKALKSLSRRGDRKGVRNMVGGIREYVESGNPLWQAFARESKHFPAVDVNLIKASEASGTLTSVLKRIADYREQRERLTKFVQVAMIYPSILVAVCLTLIIVLSKFVIPAFEEIFATMDVEIGGFSTFVMAAAGFVDSTWWLFTLIVVGLVVLHEMWWVKNPVRKLTSDQIKLRIPIFGSIIMRSVIADFTRTFAMLLRSGISIMATLDLCKNSVSNRAYASVIQDMRDSVESGEGLEAPLRNAEKKGYIPGIVVDMLLTGEESGSLEKVSDQIADTYEDEVEIAVNGLKEAITPLFVVLMGFIVGSIVIAMFLPLISMINTISGGAL